MAIEDAKTAWRPVGVGELEPAADAVVRSDRTTIVVAGPGAGKTELLAQRACFLLQTGACPDPRRILAISFKRDAARNLRERVAGRCGRELARRFDSYTFDSFSKSLVDRFLSALPPHFRPAPDYRVLDQTVLSERKILDIVRSIPSQQTGLSDAATQGLNPKAIWRAFIGRALPPDGAWVNGSNEEVAAAALWHFLLHGSAQAAVGFPMLGLMAALLLRTNPHVLSALQKSYRFVFMDEFQDTTAIHYALVLRAFQGSGATLTAVGDNKQRIMGWAGALPGIFGRFAKDFDALTVRLERNYRSAQRLVNIQSVIAKALDAESVPGVTMSRGDAGECALLQFDDDAAEALHLAELIHGWIATGDITPRDVCVLCRMKPPVYTEQLKTALARKGVRSRIENDFQDLLTEPLAETLLDMLKIAFRDRAPESWTRMVILLGNLGRDDSEAAMRLIVENLLRCSSTLRTRMAGSSTTEEEITELLRTVMAFVGPDAFKSLYPEYLHGTWYDEKIIALSKALSAARIGRAWSEAIDEIEGLGSVPIMTIHKSKGLEYHTIIFVGLEDSAHFNFASNPSEETCGLFVALSRAKRRVIFTFSRVRPTGRGGTSVGQDRRVIEPLYALLVRAGVSVRDS